MTARCRHFGVCGGCQLQDVPYLQQLEDKHRRLSSLLRKALGDAAPVVQPLIATPSDSGTPWQFRQKAAFVFADGPAGRSLVIGHFAQGSRDVVPIVECPVHGDRANRVAFALTRALARARIPAAGARLDGIVRHLLVRTSLDEREAVAMLVVTRNDRSLRAPIRAFLEGPDAPDGFYVNVHDRPGPFMVGRETIRLAGRSHVREGRFGLSFLISPTAFFQTNVEATALLLDEVVRGVMAEEAGTVRRPRTILDLYAGSGLFALTLAARGCRVTAVEENRDATRDLAANQRLNRLEDETVRIVGGRVEDALPRLARGRFDAAIVDPPRQGCSSVVLGALVGDIAPDRLVYVSCNPLALAEELPRITRAGYTIARVQPVDMFPHTDHVETVVVLSRGAHRGRGGRQGDDEQGRAPDKRNARPVRAKRA